VNVLFASVVQIISINFQDLDIPVGRYMAYIMQAGVLKPQDSSYAYQELYKYLNMRGRNSRFIIRQENCC
jgi:hypothetical protein